MKPKTHRLKKDIIMFKSKLHSKMMMGALSLEYPVFKGDGVHKFMKLYRDLISKLQLYIWRDTAFIKL